MSQVKASEQGKAMIRLLANCPKVETIKWRINLPSAGAGFPACSAIVYWHLDESTKSETIYFIRYGRVGKRLRFNRNGERAAIVAEIARQTGEHAPIAFVGM